jgi:hypothetical protein
MHMTRLLAACLLVAGLSQLSVGRAEACIKFDRAAEMALIDDAIAAKTTSDPKKAVLRALRKEMVVFREKQSQTSDDILQHHWLTTEALKLLGKERIVWQGSDEADDTPGTKTRRTKSAAIPAQPSCG